MFHVAGWRQLIDPNGALTAINALREEMLFTSGLDMRVPTALPFLIGAAALVADASGVRAQVQSPSLRNLANLDIEPIVLAATFGSIPENLFHPDSPIPLVADEALNFAVDSNPAAAAEHVGLVWLADGPQQPVVGHMFSVRATSTVQQTISSWINGSLTFSQTLPAGRYAVVGLRVRSTDGIACRLLFQEQSARPGVPVVNAIADLDPYWFRYGRAGIFGEFAHTNPPTFDIFGGVAAVQTFIIDLMRVK